MNASRTLLMWDWRCFGFWRAFECVCYKSKNEKKERTRYYLSGPGSIPRWAFCSMSSPLSCLSCLSLLSLSNEAKMAKNNLKKMKRIFFSGMPVSAIQINTYSYLKQVYLTWFHTSLWFIAHFKIFLPFSVTPARRGTLNVTASYSQSPSWVWRANRPLWLCAFQVRSVRVFQWLIFIRVSLCMACKNWYSKR